MGSQETVVSREKMAEIGQLSEFIIASWGVMEPVNDVVPESISSLAVWRNKGNEATLLRATTRHQSGTLVDTYHLYTALGTLSTHYTVSEGEITQFRMLPGLRHHYAGMPARAVYEQEILRTLWTAVPPFLRP